MSDSVNTPSFESLLELTKDAKKAPEIAVWLLGGPLSISTVIELRKQRQLGAGADVRFAEAYSSASVLRDLGRIAGFGDPVIYRDGLLRLDDRHRNSVIEWRDDGRFLHRL